MVGPGRECAGRVQGRISHQTRRYPGRVGSRSESRTRCGLPAIGFALVPSACRGGHFYAWTWTGPAVWQPGLPVLPPCSARGSRGRDECAPRPRTENPSVRARGARPSPVGPAGRPGPVSHESGALSPIGSHRGCSHPLPTPPASPRRPRNPMRTSEGALAFLLRARPHQPAPRVEPVPAHWQTR